MRGYKLGRVLGIEIRVHPSWFVIAALVVWSLAVGALPGDFPEVSAVGRFAIAAGITILFFASLLAHELAHSVVAERRGIPVHGITFFLFGGMAQTSSDSRSPGEEFVIAIAGPLCSFALAVTFIAVWWWGATNGWTPVVTATAAYVGVLNAVLGIFNMLPGFPMDGGRVLRSIIWKATGDVTRATLWAARVGGWMALGLMAYGAWQALTVDLLGGLWLVFIGMFIRSAARMSYRQHVASRQQQEALEWHGLEAGPEATGRDVTDLRPGEV